jgi:uncharacterized protein
MVEFAAYIEDHWSISFDVAHAICTHHEDQDSLFFISDYVPLIASQAEFGTLSEIYRFLDKQQALEPLRNKTRNILKKADVYDDEFEEKIELSITAIEIEDLSISYRTSVRTRGQVAIAKGLDTLADKIDEQVDGSESDLITLLKTYVGKDDSLKTEEDVLAGVTDVLAERFGYEEDARVILREYAEDEGFLEVHYKKKTKKFDDFRDKQTPLGSLTDEDVLKLKEGEVKGEIKVKIGVPIFQVNELLREHFIENDSAVGIGIIESAIDDCWNRILHPMVEDSIKEHLYEDAEIAILRSMRLDITKQVDEYVTSGKKSLVVAAAYSETEIELLALDNNGMLLRSTVEPVRNFGRSFVSGKIKQLVELYRSSTIAVVGNKLSDNTLEIITQTVDSMTTKPEVVKIPSTLKISSILKSDHLKKNYGTLSESALKTFAYGLARITPFALVVENGSANFKLHEKQSLISPESLDALVSELYTSAALTRGVEIGRKQDSLLLKTGVTEEVLEELRKAKKSKKLKGKMALANLECVNERIYNNIAGYAVFPESDMVLDKSSIHPVEFSLVDSICGELGLDVEDLIKNLDKVKDFETEDESVGKFIRTQVFNQLKVAQRYVSLSSRPKRRMRLGEVRPDAIIDGKVTNIAPFGVFIDINAVSDGLVHISELANQYVESAEQVVKVGDAVRVKVIEVNRKKKRISLSMKQADNGGRSVRASKTQLNDLASFFSK